MGQPIISVRNIGKRYQLGAALAHDTLRDHLAHSFKGLGRLFKGTSGPEDSKSKGGTHSFWALEDVSFDVEPGEVIGVIGRNGAGKSTLLKILSQITEPTTGEIHIRGRLASLLEVGTGFHPELSGRENIFLNGAILGMSRAEITAKFDEIVAFAEVEKFLDTPVKRYSSGMYVRLAFAVAAHLEPEILVVDEVLAVGDAAFQARCMGKMEDVARTKGRTVLFVSHNMTAIQTLCTRIVHLRNGKVAGIGTTEEQIGKYLSDLKEGQSNTLTEPIALGDSLQLRRFDFHPNPIISGGPLGFTVEIAGQRETSLSDVVILIYTVYGVRVAILDLRQENGAPYAVSRNRSLKIEGRIAALPFVEGDYQLGMYVQCNEYYSDFYNLAAVTVMGNATQQANLPRPARHRGTIELDCTHRTV